MTSLTKTSNINKEILRLAVPSILANITVPLVGIVDVAIAGHISNASAIGGIAIGTMLFDLLYWNFGFLRVGTGGMTAQAFGRNDSRSEIGILTKGVQTALIATLCIWTLQWLFVDIVLQLVPCSPEVEDFARRYFFIRVWAAPATLSLMVFKGWFIGMQNTVFPMACDITVNVVNMLTSYILAVHTPMGAIGVAYGTLIAQYSGLILAVTLYFVRYRMKMYPIRTAPLFSVRQSLRGTGFYKLNTTLFIRSVCMLAIYVGFTSLTSFYGDGPLAVGSIMMKLFMLLSYLIDGFAYAGEALTGRYIGANDREMLTKSIRGISWWTLGIGLLCTLVFAVSGEGMVSLITSDQQIIEGSRPFLPWLVAMPLLGCFAFMWDGIFAGATAGKHIMMCMVYAAIGFFLSYYLLQAAIGLQAVYVAYFVHLLVRAAYLTAQSKRIIINS